MKILLLFASTHGQTRSVAVTLERELRARGCEVLALDAFALSPLPMPAGFDAVVIGSRIQVGRHAAPIVAYLAEHADALRAMPVAFFSVSMAALNGGSDPNGYIGALTDRLGWRPTLTVAFAGALPYRRYNWLLRFVMKRIAKSAGHTTDTRRNHEFTDWNRVRGFADDVVGMTRNRLRHAS